MKKTKKRIGIVLLVFCLVVAMVPTVLLGAEQADQNINVAGRSVLGESGLTTEKQENEEDPDVTLGLSKERQDKDPEIILGVSENEVILGASGPSYSPFGLMDTVDSIGGLLRPEEGTKIVVIPVDDMSNYTAFDYGLNGAGVHQALFYMYSQHDVAPVGPKNFVLYLGSNNGANIAATSFSSVFRDEIIANPSASSMTFKTLQGRVNALTITGLSTDPVGEHTTLPSGSTTFSGFVEVAFGTKTYIRNIRLNNAATTLYGNGNTVLLDRGFELSSGGTLAIYGGGKSGQLVGSPNMTINSSHSTGLLTIYGGSASGDITGDVILTINRLSNATLSGIFGGGNTAGTITGDIYVTINSTPVQNFTTYAGAGKDSNVVGNVTTTINNLNSAITTYYGGNMGTTPTTITGTVTNIVKPSVKSAAVNAGFNFFYGGSQVGTIGTQGSGAPAIVNDVDFRNFGKSRAVASFGGGHRTSGTIYGSISNTVYAGDYLEGGQINQYHGGASQYATVYNLPPASFVFDNPSAVAAAYEAGTLNKIYGDITNNLKGGCFSDGASYYNTGAGRTGYIEGNVYTELGTVEKVYGRNFKNTELTEIANPNYGANNRGNATVMDWTGAGGYPATNTTMDMFIKGNTTLVHRQTLARWTYGAGFSGLIWGNTAIEIYGGVVDTLEGAGYMDRMIWGNTSATVYGGQVDWFMSGAGWMGKDVVGDVSTNIYGGTVNAHLGGGYNTDMVTGNSLVNIYGGDFSGSPRDGGMPKKLAAGPSYGGTITGNAVFNLDLTNTPDGGFKPPQEGSYISGGRPYAANATILGTDENNTVELNIKTKPGSDLLNGVKLFIDGGISGETKSGTFTANIDAPDAKIGALFASQKSILTSATGYIKKQVDINIYNAGEIGELAGSAELTDNFTNTVANNQFGKRVTINFIGNTEIPKTNVGIGGIYNFTHMTVDDYEVLVQDGTIRNGRNATNAYANRQDYFKFGEIKLSDKGSFGVSGAAVYITAGDLIVSGNPKIVSPAGDSAINLSSVTMLPSSTLNWVKNGGTTVAATGTWFGGTPKAYRVINFSPAVAKDNAKALTPSNFFGTDLAGVGYYIGDNDRTTSATVGHGIVVEGMRIDYEVEGTGGAISHNVNASFDPPATTPVTGLSSSLKDVQSTSGWLIVPITVVPSPELKFSPTSATFHWLQGATIERVNAGTTTIPEQTNSDPYSHSFPATGWYKVKARYKNTPEITAKNMVITEKKAGELASIAEVVKLMDASGRPQFAHNIDDAMLGEIRKELTGTYRVHDLAFTVDNGVEQKSANVKLFVVPNDAVIDVSGNYALWTRNVTITVAQSKLIANQTDLDAYTLAFALDVTGGTVSVPTITNSGVIAEFAGVTSPTTKTVEYGYMTLSKNSVVTILSGAPEWGTTPPNLIFGSYKNAGVSKELPLSLDAVLQVKDERPAGATLQIQLIADDFALSGGSHTLPANRLIYVDASGIPLPLGTIREVWSGASIAGTPVQTKTWTAGTTQESFIFDTTGFDLIGDYSTTVTWSMVFAP